jgi:hypothetical protein
MRYGEGVPRAAGGTGRNACAIEDRHLASRKNRAASSGGVGLM